MGISLSSVTRPAVLQAIQRYDELGQQGFFDEYHFSHALEYFLVEDGRDYDSKAIVGVAHGFATGDFKESSDFSGGKPVAERLRALGFTVTEKSDWTPTENRAVVASYLAMLTLELHGTPFNKSAENARLREHLHGRSHKSIEFKYQNISAVLAQNNLFYIDGYKPAHHIQRSLRDEVVRQLEVDSVLDRAMATRAEEMAIDVPRQTADELRVVDPPKITLVTSKWQPREIGIKRDYSTRDTANRKLGLAGEFAVVAYEKARLVLEGRPDLAEGVMHESVTRGDGLGYDVRSFDSDGADRYIEVKTTMQGREVPFFVSRYEVAASTYFDEKYYLYRLFKYGSTDQGMYVIRGPLSESCDLRAETLVGAPRLTPRDHPLDSALRGPSLSTTTPALEGQS
ncbi:DUF3883 domain-containing protein [Mycobacterium yunnanensis]|uniref:DUF3883 domain-containing protein n=1 Tax=Mycobacterium yunnanensis TaxID=368477 RepID=A0A9X2YHF4_9MYCO|nr:DUF3883 domain-containing protein [Mycobacterium yunnanensis]MCV7419322.1 DUF3883 domain-containing protein [Mycobacterium yunnanensis]